VLAIGGLICWAWAPETSTESLSEVAELVQKESDDHTHHSVQQSR
jgi:putative MFS transporter